MVYDERKNIPRVFMMAEIEHKGKTYKTLIDNFGNVLENEELLDIMENVIGYLNRDKERKK